MLPLFDSRKELEAARQRLTQALVELDRRRLQALSNRPVSAGIRVRTEWAGGAGNQVETEKPAPHSVDLPAVLRVKSGAGAQSVAARLRAWFAAGRQR